MFGRQGLDVATLWAPPALSSPGFYAFKIFRNYDNSGGSFGDVSVSAASADQCGSPRTRPSDPPTTP